VSSKKTDTSMPDRRTTINGWALSNMLSTETGVGGAVIWISAGEFGGRDSHAGPRIVVVLGEAISTEGLADAASVRLADPPEVLGHLPGKIKREAVKFVVMNRDALLRYWDCEIDTKEMVNLVERI
jgi:hypothetical protein